MINIQEMPAERPVPHVIGGYDAAGAGGIQLGVVCIAESFSDKAVLYTAAERAVIELQAAAFDPLWRPFCPIPIEGNIFAVV